MRLEQASFTHPGSCSPNRDAARVVEEGERLYAVVCSDGAESEAGVGAVAADTVLAALRAKPEEASPGLVAPEQAQAAPQQATPAQVTPGQALSAAHRTLQELQASKEELASRRISVAAFTLDAANGELLWASVGDSRVYVCAGERLVVLSPDDSAGFAAYLRGETDREGIRLAEGRGQLTAGLGDADELVPHEGVVRLNAGDAVLLCSDGFWEYVYDFEMQLDFLKSSRAEQWLRLMLLRLVQRSYLAGDSMTALIGRLSV